MENIFKDKITLSDKIKKIRIENGMNQKDFSSLLGVKQSYYSELENGKREVTTKILSELKDKLNISMDWFLNNSDNDTTKSIYSNSNITNNEFRSSERTQEITINGQEATHEQLFKAFAWLIFSSYKSKFNTDIKFDSFTKLSQTFWASHKLCEDIQLCLELEITNNIMKDMKSYLKEGKEESVMPDMKHVIDKYDSIYNDFMCESDMVMKLIDLTSKHQSTLAEIISSAGIENNKE